MPTIRCWLGAREHVPAEVSLALSQERDAGQLVETCLAHGIAEIAIRGELVQSALQADLSNTLDPVLARRLGVEWNEAVRWMFDLEQIPSLVREELERHRGRPISSAQDWELASQHCRRVCELAPNLAWAWDLIGYAAERSDQPEVAVQAYLQGASCSVFSDQSVRMRTHWTGDGAAKFSAARLQSCFPGRVQQSDYLQRLCDSDAAVRRRRVSEHWQAAAAEATEAENWVAAHRCLVAAGWDLGTEPLASYAGLLEKISLAADNADQVARAVVARVHRQCLRERYGF